MAVNAEDVFPDDEKKDKPAGAVRPLEPGEDFTPLNDPNLVTIRPLGENEEFFSADEKTFGQKIAGRFMGSDVDDKLELSRIGAVTIGAVAGAELGTTIQRPPGPLGVVINPITGAFAFGIAGAATGAVAPEAALELGEATGLLEQGITEKVGLSPDDLRTVVEGEALLELATLGGVSAMRFAGRGFSQLFAGIKEGGKKAADLAAKHGIALLPVQVGEREIARGYVAVMGRFPFFAGPIKQSGRAAEQQAKTAVKGISSRVGPIAAWNDIGVDIFNDATELVGKSEELFNTMYTDIFRRAEEAGVQAIPRATINKAGEVLETIAKKTPAGVEGPTEAGKAFKKVVKFINKSILPMSSQVGEQTVVAKQSLTQMDGLIGKIDQEIASLKPGQKEFAKSLLVQLRQSVQLDMLKNLRGQDADIIANQLRAADTLFSSTMSQLFETATAKRFGSVQARGLRAFGFKQTTRTPVDKLASIVSKLDSPQAIDELSRLVTQETMQRITATTIDDAMMLAVRSDGQEGLFNVSKFAKALGIDNPRSPKALSMEKMLEKSGSPLSMADLSELVQSLRQLESLEIPNVSSFIARRATLGGFKAMISGLIPGLAVGGGAGTALSGSFGVGSLLGVLAFLGTGRMLSRALSNPLSARAIKQVMNEEASAGVRRAAWVKAIRITIAAMRDDDEITEQEFSNLEGMRRIIMLEMDKFAKTFEAPTKEETE